MWSAYSSFKKSKCVSFMWVRLIFDQVLYVVIFLLFPLFTDHKGNHELYVLCVCGVHQSVLIQSVRQWIVWPFSLSLPLLFPSTLSFSSRVCACSSQCVRRCCGSSRESCFVATAFRWGAGGRRRCSGRDLYLWRNVGREPLPSASATANCVGAPDCLSLSPTDWRRKLPWWRGGAATSGFAPSADASRDWGCVPQGPLGPSHLPHTVRRA